MAYEWSRPVPVWDTAPAWTVVRKPQSNYLLITDPTLLKQLNPKRTEV